MPLIYRESDDKLIGHIDIFNPQTPLMRDDNELTIIFSGPDCYISPSVYATTQLPTWNYIKVHLKGTVVAIESKEALKESLIKMTEFLEAPDHKYVLDANNKRMESNLDYIKMFEITITDWEGKFKLSQDKRKQDRVNAYEQLIKANQQSVKGFLDKIFNPES
jgi:transcriptional regulator